MIAPYGNLPLAAAQRNFLGTPFLPNQAAFLPNSAAQIRNAAVHHRLLAANHGQPPVAQPALDPAQEKISAVLDDKELWRSFNQIGTEMVITKNGR